MVDAELDELILSVTQTRWLKVARIVGQTVAQLEHAGCAPDLKLIARRIEALAGVGVLESRGDLSQWRYSEIRQANRDGALAAIQKWHPPVGQRVLGKPLSP